MNTETQQNPQDTIVKPTNITKDAKEIVDITLAEIESQLSMTLRLNQEVIKTVAKIVESCIRNVANKIRGNNNSENKGLILDQHDQIQQLIDQNKQWLESLGLDPEELFDDWKISHASKKKLTLETIKPLMFVAQLNALFLGLRPELLDNIVSAMLISGTIVQTNYLNRLLTDFTGLIKNNIHKIRVLATIDPDFPSHLNRNFGIRCFSRYPTTQLLAQSRRKELDPQKRQVLSISAIIDNNGALHSTPGGGSGITTFFPGVTFLQAIRHGYEVTVAEAASVAELNDLVRSFRDSKSMFDYVILNAHGDHNGIVLSDTEFLLNHDTRTSVFFQHLGTIMHPNAEMLLNSCRAGSSADGFASFAARHLSRITRAYNKSTIGRVSISKKDVRLTPLWIKAVKEIVFDKNGNPIESLNQN